MEPLWIDFVNSEARDYLGHGRHRDRLEDPGWLRPFLQRWGLPAVGVRHRPHRDALRGLRSLLRRLVTAIVEDEPIADRDLDQLNRHLAARPVRSRLEKTETSFRMQLVPTGRGIDAVLFAVAASFAEFLTEGDPTRLKTCDNPDCRWVFYDRTRSRTRRWCADTCGNLIKVRRFRGRRKTADAPTAPQRRRP